MGTAPGGPVPGTRYCHLGFVLGGRDGIRVRVSAAGGVISPVWAPDIGAAPCGIGPDMIPCAGKSGGPWFIPGAPGTGEDISPAFPPGICAEPGDAGIGAAPCGIGIPPGPGPGSVGCCVIPGMTFCGIGMPPGPGEAGDPVAVPGLTGKGDSLSGSGPGIGAASCGIGILPCARPGIVRC